MPRTTLKMLSAAISGNVRMLKDQRGLSQRKLAGAGVSQKSVSNILRMPDNNNNGAANIRTIHGLASQLNVPAYQLLIQNLPQESTRRTQLDRLVKGFIAATPAQQDWIITTLEMMNQVQPKRPT